MLRGMVTLAAALARLVAACPDMADLALDIHGMAATRGEAEATAVAAVAAKLAEEHAARRRANCLGYESQASPPGPVKGERWPRADERRVVWLVVEETQTGWRPRMGPPKAGQDHPPGAAYWTMPGWGHWVCVPGA